MQEPATDHLGLQQRDKIGPFERTDWLVPRRPRGVDDATQGGCQGRQLGKKLRQRSFVGYVHLGDLDRGSLGAQLVKDRLLNGTLHAPSAG